MAGVALAYSEHPGYISGYPGMQPSLRGICILSVPRCDGSPSFIVRKVSVRAPSFCVSSRHSILASPSCPPYLPASLLSIGTCYTPCDTRQALLSLLSSTNGYYFRSSRCRSSVSPSPVLFGRSQDFWRLVCRVENHKCVP